MKTKHSVVIRMGAPAWDATVNGARFDFRAMTYDQKKLWYGAFMDSVRALYGKGKGKRGRR